VYCNHQVAVTSPVALLDTCGAAASLDVLSVSTGDQLDPYV
jgi:hypothetical protein